MLQHDLSNESVELREESYVLGTYARTSFHPRSGKGAKIVDADGVARWDLLGGIGVNVLGHGHPAIKRALLAASKGLLHVSNLYYHPWQGILADRLLHATGLSKAFFCNSGTEANEAALKFARLANPGRTKLVALDGSFHGRTFGSLSVTGRETYRAPFAPLLAGEVAFAKPNDIDSLEQAIDDDTSAVILEPVMGEGGVIPLDIEFMQAASRLAAKHRAVLICDEVQSGIGRTGSFYAHQISGILPDIVTLGKPIGGGLPLGAVLVTRDIANLVKPGMHGTTFGGNPVACQLGIALLQTIANDRLLDRVTALGDFLESRLRPLVGTLGIVDVRGAGLIQGIELDQPAGPIVSKLFDHGFIAGTAGDRVIRILPPYIIEKKTLAGFVSTLEKILKENQQ